MSKTIAELREEVRLEKVADMAEVAKGVVNNIDLKIEERKRWIAQRERQISELGSLFPLLDEVLKAEAYKELPKFASLIETASSKIS